MPSLSICLASLFAPNGVSNGLLHELHVYGRNGPTASVLGFNYCS